MSILFIQPIFAPDKPRLRRNLDSIESFGAYLEKYPYPDLDVKIGGWAKEEYWPELKEQIQKYIGKTQSIKKFDKNYGKAKTVNSLYEIKNKSKKYNYLLTADSDIIFSPDEPHIFDRLVDAAKKLPKLRGKPFGLISLNQKAQNCHLPNEVYKNRKKFKGKYGDEEVVWPNGKGGIAGGCIFCPTKVWEKVGGYRVMGIYSGDDAYFLVDVCDRGYSIQMFETLSIIHPHDHDQEYAKWKVKVCQRDSGHVKKDLSKYIKEADEFWDSHGKN